MSSSGLQLKNDLKAIHLKANPQPRSVYTSTFCMLTLQQLCAKGENPLFSELMTPQRYSLQLNLYWYSLIFVHFHGLGNSASTNHCTSWTPNLPFPSISGFASHITRTIVVTGWKCPWIPVHSILDISIHNHSPLSPIDLKLKKKAI